MSYKTEIQSNNTDLQKLIDTTNNLPINENLDSEIATQKDLISKIASELQTKIEESEKNNIVTYSCTATFYSTASVGFYGFFDIDGNAIDFNPDGYTIDFSNYVGQLIVAHGDSNMDYSEERFYINIDDENALGDVPVLEEDAWGSSTFTDEYEWNWYFIVPKYNIIINHDPGDVS